MLYQQLHHLPGNRWVASVPATIPLWSFTGRKGISGWYRLVSVQQLSSGNYYAVGASDGATGGCQATSATATVVPKPKNLTATNVTSTTADVNWTTISCVQYYFVQYRVLGDTKWKKKTTVGNVGTYHLTGLAHATTYEYRVAANDSASGQTANGKYSDISNFGTLARMEGPEASAQQNLSVYPNPASTNVYVSFENGTEGQVTMKLFDVTGRIVFVRNEQAASGNVNEQLDLFCFEHRRLPAPGYHG